MSEDQRIPRGGCRAAAQAVHEGAHFLEIGGSPRNTAKAFGLALKAAPLRRRCVVAKRAQRGFGTAVFRRKILMQIPAEHALQHREPGACPASSALLRIRREHVVAPDDASSQRSTITARSHGTDFARPRAIVRPITRSAR